MQTLQYSLHRIKIYNNFLKTRKFAFSNIKTKLFSTKAAEEIEGQLVIGDVIKQLKTPKNPELVPRKYGM